MVINGPNITDLKKNQKHKNQALIWPKVTTDWSNSPANHCSVKLWRVSMSSSCHVVAQFLITPSPSDFLFCRHLILLSLCPLHLNPHNIASTHPHPPPFPDFISYTFPLSPPFLSPISTSLLQIESFKLNFHKNARSRTDHGADIVTMPAHREKNQPRPWDLSYSLRIQEQEKAPPPTVTAQCVPVRIGEHRCSAPWSEGQQQTLTFEPRVKSRQRFAPKICAVPQF